MKKLTYRQREVLDFIRFFIESRSFPPTIREVADRFGITVRGGYDHIKALEKKQYIRCKWNRSRSIKILEERNPMTRGVIMVRILGSVAAGVPLFAEENFEGSIDVPTKMLGQGEFFAVRVKGDSMQEAGILDGDLAVMKHQETAENGEIVIAMVEDAVTLKKIYTEKNRIQLKSENQAYPPIYTQDVRILGKLACIIRSYTL